MRRTLQEIRAVQGVSGVIAVDRQDNLAFHLTPAHIEPSHVIELSQNVLRLVRESPARSLRYYFRYTGGQVLVYSLRRAVVVVLGKGHLNLQLLGLVTRATFPTIERKLSSAADKEVPTPLTVITVEPGQLSVCVEAFNVVMRYLAERASEYVVTHALRRSKDLLLARFPILRNYVVSDDGEVSIVRGRESDIAGHTIRGLAFWMDATIGGAKAYSQELEHVDVRALTSPASEVLSLTGFYAYVDSLMSGGETLT